MAVRLGYGAALTLARQHRAAPSSRVLHGIRHTIRHTEIGVADGWRGPLRNGVVSSQTLWLTDIQASPPKEPRINRRGTWSESS
jgi:hypothetical protein